MSSTTAVHRALQQFAETVKDKMTQYVFGEPEDQLRGPFENLMADVAAAFGWKLVCTGETSLPGRRGRPDFAVHLNDLLVGYAELKAPGVGAVATRFKGRNREQFRRFSAIPNLLYTDGNEWALYRYGERVGDIVRLDGDITVEGKKAVTPKNALALERLIRDFLSWEPFIPYDEDGRIELKGFAKLVAPLCRMLREDVLDALQASSSPFVRLAEDWRQLLFPDTSMSSLRTLMLRPSRSPCC